MPLLYFDSQYLPINLGFPYLNIKREILSVKKQPGIKGSGLLINKIVFTPQRQNFSDNGKYAQSCRHNSRTFPKGEAS